MTSASASHQTDISVLDSRAQARPDAQVTICCIEQSLKHFGFTHHWFVFRMLPQQFWYRARYAVVRFV
jgi:hypothetical protein